MQPRKAPTHSGPSPVSPNSIQASFPPGSRKLVGLLLGLGLSASSPDREALAQVAANDTKDQKPPAVKPSSVSDLVPGLRAEAVHFTQDTLHLPGTIDSGCSVVLAASDGVSNKGRDTLEAFRALSSIKRSIGQAKGIVFVHIIAQNGRATERVLRHAESRGAQFPVAVLYESEKSRGGGREVVIDQAQLDAASAALGAWLKCEPGKVMNRLFFIQPGEKPESFQVGKRSQLPALVRDLKRLAKANCDKEINCSPRIENKRFESSKNEPFAITQQEFDAKVDTLLGIYSNEDSDCDRSSAEIITLARKMGLLAGEENKLPQGVERNLMGMKALNALLPLVSEESRRYFPMTIQSLSAELPLTGEDGKLSAEYREALTMYEQYLLHPDSDLRCEAALTILVDLNNRLRENEALLTEALDTVVPMAERALGTAPNLMDPLARASLLNLVSLDDPATRALFTSSFPFIVYYTEASQEQAPDFEETFGLLSSPADYERALQSLVEQEDLHPKIRQSLLWYGAARVRNSALGSGEFAAYGEAALRALEAAPADDYYSRTALTKAVLSYYHQGAFSGETAQRAIEACADAAASWGKNQDFVGVTLQHVVFEELYQKER